MKSNKKAPPPIIVAAAAPCKTANTKTTINSNQCKVKNVLKKV